MKKIILGLVVAVGAATAMQAKPVKRPDSYAFTRGVEAFNNDNYSEAADWFKQELKENPDNGYVYTYISLIHTKNDEYGAALSAINNAIKKTSKKDKAWYAHNYATRAGVYLAMEDTTNAVKDLNTAVGIVPDDTNLLELRGDLYYKMKEYDLSDADYMKMHKLDEGATYPLMGIGRNADQRGNHDKAIEYYSRVITIVR